jgi:hypothetical protein
MTSADEIGLGEQLKNGVTKMKIETVYYLGKMKDTKDEIETQFRNSRFSVVLEKKYYAAALGICILALLLVAFPVMRWNLVLALYMPTTSNLYFAPPALFTGIWNAYLLTDVEFSLPKETQMTDAIELFAEDYSWAKFKEVSDGFTRPVILRGLFASSAAVKTFGSDEWLASHGNFTLQTIIDRAKTYQYNYDFEDVQIEEYISDIKAGKFRYSYGLNEIYVKYPELVGDLEIERFANAKKPVFCRSIALFVSSAGRGLKWHNADSSNLAMQIQGSKIFYMIDPKYSMFMGPQGNADPYATGFSCRSPKSVIDRVPRIKAHVHPGDVIFTPVWWWHSIETFADAETKLNVLNTCRYNEAINALRINPTLELIRHMGFVNWIHPKLPIAVRWIPFFRVFQDGIRQWFNAMPDYDSEDCFSSKRKACERYFESLGYETGKAHY